MVDSLCLNFRVFKVKIVSKNLVTFSDSPVAVM